MCHISVLSTKKGFNVSLCNRKVPFKSDKMNSLFFKMPFAKLKVFLGKHPMKSRRLKRHAVKELIKKNAGKIKTVSDRSRRIVGPLDRYLV